MTSVLSLHGILGKLQKNLSRSPLAVAGAVKVRNQCQMVLQWYLGEDNRRELNGEQQIIELVAPSSSTFIDVGANVGDWTALFLGVGGVEKRGLLLEPSSSALAKLQERFRESGNIELVHAAVSDEPGESTFYEEANAGETSSLVPTFSVNGAQGVRVAVTTVDEAAAKAGLSYVDFLKVDTEGYDYHVLRGAGRLLSEQSVGIIQFEYNRPWVAAGSTLSSAITFLQSFGYKLFLLRSTGIHPFNYARYGEFYSCSNFVAVSPRKMDVVAALIRPMV